MATSGSDYASLRKRLDALIADAQARRAAEERGSTGQIPWGEPVTLAAPPTVSPYRRILPEATATSEEFAPGTVEPFGATLGHAVGLDEPEDVLPWAAKQLGLYYGGGLALKGAGATLRAGSKGVKSLRGLLEARQAASVPARVAEAQALKAAGFSHPVASRLAGTPGGGKATATIIRHDPQVAFNPLNAADEIAELGDQGFALPTARKVVERGLSRGERGSLRGLEEAGHQARVSRAGRPAASLAESGQRYLDLLGGVYRRAKTTLPAMDPERRMAGRALAESGKASTGLDIMKNLYRKNPVRLLNP